MRFLVMVKASRASEAGQLPTSEMLAEMGAFNQKLAKDGVILAADGLHPSSKGARIAFADGKPTVTDGPFTETKELVAGFWILQGKSKDEIVARLSQAPFENGQVEIRQIFEPEDFGDIRTPEIEAQRAEVEAGIAAQLKAHRL
jgi:hypothetical protein